MKLPVLYIAVGVAVLLGTADAAKPISITTSSLPDGTVGIAYSQQLEVTGGTGGYMWYINVGGLPAGLGLSIGGTISGTPTVAGKTDVSFTVIDNSNEVAQAVLSITVNPTPPLTVTTASLPAGTAGTAYSQTLAATGGTGGYAWKVTAGAMPAGLSLSAGGSISGTPTAPGTANFTAAVTDSSNHTASKPLSILVNPAPLTVTTASLPGGTAGTSYSQALAANGGTGGYAWSISGGRLPAGLNLSSAGTISGTPTTAGTANFTATVTDSSNRSASGALSIVVSPAPLTITTSSLPAGTAGAAYSQTVAASGGTGGYSWSVSGALPAGLSLSAGGTISGTPTAAGTATFTVTVTDNSNHSASGALSIVVNPAPIAITTASLQAGMAGTPYSQTLAASGGTGGYAWSVSSGGLPAGLTLSAGGTISGTPAAAGTTNFTATVTDSSSHSASKPLSITVAPPSLTVTTASLANGTVGVAYSQTLAASGGTGGYSWSVTAGGLQTGLSLSTAGAISGTPTAAGTANFTAQVKDASGFTAAKALTLTVALPPVTITTQALPSAEQGAPYSQVLAATGGTGSYTWSILSGTLPPGLVLDGSGRISGAATGPSTTFAVQATDGAGTAATKALTLTVTPGPAFTNQSTLATGVVGTAYDAAPAISGGQAPYTFSMVGGQLPPGLTLNGNGHVAGTPLQPGSFSFSMQARDAAGSQTQATFTIPIVNGLTFSTPPVLPGASLGVTYQAALAAAGGTTPYTFSVTSGSLPGGLSFHADGRIDGAPTAAGSFQFTAGVTDANGVKASKQFSLSVAGALTITTAPTLTAAVLGASYSATLGANGGTPPYSWSITAGGIPPGLTFAAGTLAGTPTAAGTFTFTAAVADSASVTVSKAFAVTVSPGVTVTSPAILPNATAGVAYTFTLVAAGGQAPYAWRMTNGALPDGLSLSGASGAIAGTPTATGTFNFTLEVADATGLKGSQTVTLITDLPTFPALAISGVPTTLVSLQQPGVDLTLSAPYPVAVTGRLNLVFVPANGMPDDPAVQFSSGGRSVAFTISANATHATFAGTLAVQSGSVAGTIQFTAESLAAGTVPLTAPGAPVLTAQVASAAPVLRTVTLARGTDGFSVQIGGLSNTRELASATVRFVPSAGSSVQASQVTIALTDAAGAWFTSAASNPYGGQFTLTLPFSISGGTVSLDSVAVVLTNQVGASQEASAQY
jgi:hypothetical protein